MPIHLTKYPGISRALRLKVNFFCHISSIVVKDYSSFSFARLQMICKENALLRHFFDCA